MKPKKIFKNLPLSKETIVNLDSLKVKGGIPYPLTRTCKTFDLSNCETWEVLICKPCNTTMSVCVICP